MNTASLQHVFLGPGHLADSLTGSGHLVVESGFIEEALKDVTEGVVQWTVVAGLSHEPAFAG
eukprot:1336317-Pyramimonas_sp.AAC.1